MSFPNIFLNQVNKVRRCSILIKIKMVFMKILFYILTFSRKNKNKAIFVAMGAHSIAIGEFTIFIHIFKKIKWRYPKHYLVVEIHPSNKELSRCIPFVDKWIEYSGQTTKIKISEILHLSKFDFELAFLFFVWQKYHSFAFCFDPKNTKMIVEEPLTGKAHWNFFKRFSQYQCLEEIKDDFNKDKFMPELFIPVETNYIMSKVVADRGVKINMDIVILSPGLSRSGPRQWPKERFIELGKKLLRNFSIQVVIIGSSIEKDLTEDIAFNIGPGAVALGGYLKVDELVAFIKKASLLIGNDSGTSHIARAVETSCITVYGPTEFIPQEKPNFIPLTRAQELSCYPCGHNCKKSSVECMELIDSDKVIEIATRYINRNAAT